MNKEKRQLLTLGKEENKKLYQKKKSYNKKSYFQVTLSEGSDHLSVTAVTKFSLEETPGITS